MAESAPLLAAAVAAAGGVAVALLYLGVLWLCVRGIAGARHPGAWLVASGVGRIVLVCAGLWVASGGEALLLLAALAGFVVIRSLALAFTRKPAPRAASSSSSAAEPTR